MLVLRREKFESIVIRIDEERHYIDVINRPIITVGIGFSIPVRIVTPKEYSGEICKKWNAGKGTEFVFNTRYGDVLICVNSINRIDGNVDIGIKASRSIEIYRKEAERGRFNHRNRQARTEKSGNSSYVENNIKNVLDNTEIWD